MVSYDIPTPGTRPRQQPSRRVLLCQPRWLGDVLLCTPALHALRRALPDAQIDFLTEPAGAAALQDNPDVSEIVLLPEPASARLALMRRMRRAGYDAVIDFRSTGSTAAVTAATGAPMRIGTRGRGLRNLAYTRLLQRETRPVYMARQKLDMLSPLGLDTGGDLSLRIAIHDEQRARAAEVLAAAGVTRGETLVAVSGASRLANKRWGAPHWARVADHLAGRGCRIILTHGPGEREQATAIARLMRHDAITDYGSTTIRDLAALYEACALWLGNDGGPKHIAAAAGVPTVSVVRAGNGAVWNDVDDPRQRFVGAAGACSVCDGPCVGDADAATVIRYAQELLAG
jgi:ADP-heptose:LPS heptosyltransferase